MAGHRTSRRRLVGSVFLVVALFLVPLGVGAIDFTDVAPNNVHAEGINWMAQTGVSRGCDDNLFCPDNLLPREQMATFMYRLSGNDPNTPPSVNADKVDGQDASAFLTAGSTIDADTLDGKDSTAFLPTSHAPRVAFASTVDVDEAVVDPSGVALTVTLTAPAKGIVTATGVIDVTANGGTDWVLCGIGRDFTFIDGSQMYVTVDDATMSTSETVCATAAAFVVDAGEVTIDLATLRLLTQTAQLFHANLWVQWVPYDGTGSVPAAASQPAPGATHYVAGR